MPSEEAFLTYKHAQDISIRLMKEVMRAMQVTSLAHINEDLQDKIVDDIENHVHKLVDELSYIEWHFDLEDKLLSFMDLVEEVIILAVPNHPVRLTVRFIEWAIASVVNSINDSLLVPLF